MRRLRVVRGDERGFTLPEVTIVIVLMSILFSIASSTWFGVVESRRVDSATSQVAADLRSTHTKAINRLEDWRIEMDDGTRDYRIGIDGGTLSANSLPERTEFLLGMGVSDMVFESDSGAQITGSGNVQVAAEDGSPCHEIEVNIITSRVEVSRNAC